MPHPGRNNIYDATIKRMVNEALEAQEQEFFRNRGNDSDEQLLAYLRLCAKALGHTPWPREIVGGSILAQRFDSWEKALKKANLPKSTTPNKLTCFACYLEETERQKEIYRKKKADKKQRAQQRLEKQKAKQSV